ncbi:MAG: hypothetical protein LBN01_00005 [Endomicrobium sp.]|jgi:hypothetical protein|nr:hypothetical protein [Endomicrobium sp.]
MKKMLSIILVLMLASQVFAGVRMLEDIAAKMFGDSKSEKMTLSIIFSGMMPYSDYCDDEDKEIMSEAFPYIFEKAVESYYAQRIGEEWIADHYSRRLEPLYKEMIRQKLNAQHSGFAMQAAIKARKK